MREERNLFVLCQAVIEAAALGLNFRLTLVGSGPKQDELEELANSSGGVVTVNPAVPHAEISRILADNDIGVLPFPDELKFRVSSPIKLFEYMAAGMPILATRIECHTDVVGDGAYTFWSESSDLESLIDALRLVLRERESLPELGSKASEAAGEWTWQSSAALLDDALRKAVNLESETSPIATSDKANESAV